MALNLYRRDSRTGHCLRGHKPDSQSYQADERRRGWRVCDCSIYASGKLADGFRKRNTGKSNWEDAQAVADAWLRAGAWSGEPEPKRYECPSATPSEANAGPITAAAALAAWLANRKARQLAPSTYRKYDYFARQLQRWCDANGSVLILQLGPIEMDAFYASWTDKPRSRAKKLERLKQFVKFCVKRKWLSSDIGEDLTAPPGASKSANKSPFSDVELDRIFRACTKLGGPVPPGPGHRTWSGDDVAAVIQLLVHTGLRISDVATFDIRTALDGDRVWVRTHKTGAEVLVPIPAWLLEDLRRRQKRYGPLIFACGESQRIETRTDLWRRRINKVFELAGPFDDPPCPHRFRHTFVRKLLQDGFTAAEAAELIGDTPEMVRRHYSKWVPERQATIDAKLRLRFAERPFMAIAGGRSS